MKKMKGQRNIRPSGSQADATKMNIGAAAIRADLARRAGRYEEAISCAKGALRFDPTHVGLLETLAGAQWQAGLYPEVLATLRKLIEINPYEPGYHSLAGTTYQCMGEFREAIRCFDRCRDLPHVASQLNDLQDWQASLVAELLKNDPVFRAQYEQNAVMACEKKGFALVITSSSRDVAATVPMSLSEQTARPS